jgi:hypothetical protein
MATTEHLGQQFYRQWQLVKFDTIIADEQPARESLVIGMNPVAKRSLRDFHYLRVHEFQKEHLKTFSTSKFLSGVRDAHTVAAASGLYQMLKRTGGQAEHRAHSHGPFAATHRNFNMDAFVASAQHREDGVARRKLEVADGRTKIIQNLE